MARSPAHKLGQIIGEVLEKAVKCHLQKLVTSLGLYLDEKGPRPARGQNNKVTWTDKYGNKHDLDFVIEKDGTPDNIGKPIAFIETAYRRYTRHSKNKVQEIEGALVPLVQTFELLRPFAGAVLTGDFTEPAVRQLESKGICVVHIPNDVIVRAFAIVNLNVQFDENTPDEETKSKVDFWERLSTDERHRVVDELVRQIGPLLQDFKNRLESAFMRKVDLIVIIPLHGKPFETKRVEEAIEFIKNYTGSSVNCPVVKYQVQVQYTNGDRVEGQFANKDYAIQFLRLVLQGG
jgi:hypothetical protein